MKDKWREESMKDNKAENEDSYIEIELDYSSCAMVKPPTLCSNPGKEDDKVDEDEQENEEELRISISSRIALPNNVDDDEQFCVVNFSEKSINPLASSMSGPLPPLVRQISSADSNEGRVKLGEFNVQNGSLSDHNSTRITLNSCHDMGLHSPTRHSRGKEGSMRRRNGGMIMKMLIKFRGIKLSTVISSLLKPPSCQDQNNNNKGRTRKYCRTILQCYHQKNMVVNPSVSSCQEEKLSASSKRLSKSFWDFNNNINNISSNDEGSFRSSRRSSWNKSVVEIDLGALKGMFSSVGTSQKGNSSNKRKSCSTMSSCDNSPIHEGFSITRTSDNSIQAAIAYCKTSFGQTSDFSFS